MGLSDIIDKIPTSKELKGNFGEWLAKYYSKVNLDALVLHDVLIDGKDGYTSQIDMILVGVKGLYVVEVKMYDEGKVYGDGKKRNWYYYLHGHKYEFYNPILQNKNHIKYLKDMLSDFGDIPFFSIVLLICNDFKVSNMNTGDKRETIVCSSLPAMTRAIKVFAEENDVVFTEEKKREIYNFIKCNQYQGKEARLKHKKDVKEYKQSLDDCKGQHICPYCKIPLILRNGKYGKFYGCSNYPKCKYTEKQNED